MSEPGPPVDAEDLKLVRLARAASARASGREGAAVRDEDGRTYAAVAVSLPSLALRALEVAVAMAASSGATALEAAAIVSDPAPGEEAYDGQAHGLAALRDLGGPGVPVLLAGTDGSVRETRRT